MTCLKQHQINNEYHTENYCNGVRVNEAGLHVPQYKTRASSEKADSIDQPVNYILIERSKSMMRTTNKWSNHGFVVSFI